MLSVENKKKLAQALKKMEEAGETEERKQLLVNAFQKKYGEKEPETKPKGTFLEDIKSIGTGIKEDITRRVGEIDKFAKQGISGEVSGAETGFRMVGEVTGGLGDIFGRTVLGGIKALVPAVIEEKLGDAAKKLLDTELGERAVIALNNGIESYRGFKQENPRFAENLEASLNIMDFAIDIATIGGAKAIKESVKEGFEEAGEKALKTELKGKGLVREGIEKVAKTPIASGTKDILETSGETISRSLLGLDLKQFKTAMKDPAKFRKMMETVDRESITNKFISSLDERLSDLSDIGKQYQPIRETATAISRSTDDIFQEALQKKGIDLKDGVITVSRKSRESLTAADKVKLNELLETFDGQLDPDSFLNLRHRLSEIANYDKEASSGLQKVARDIRGELNNYRDEIPGLEDLDKIITAEKKILDPIKKKLYTSSGELKDNAISIISNLDSKNKKIVLEKFSDIMPDLEEQLNILKSIENMEIAQGLKVGDYTRGVLRSAGVAGGIASGNPLLTVASMVVTSPNILLILMDGVVSSGKFAKKIIDPIKNKLVKGIKLTVEELKIVGDVLTASADDIALSMGRKEVIEQLEQ